MIRILIADDQTLVRGGLRMILDAQFDITVVGEAGDGREAFELVCELNPDLVLMDVEMTQETFDLRDERLQAYHLHGPPSRPMAGCIGMLPRNWGRTRTLPEFQLDRVIDRRIAADGLTTSACTDGPAAQLRRAMTRCAGCFRTDRTKRSADPVRPAGACHSWLGGRRSKRWGTSRWGPPERRGDPRGCLSPCPGAARPASAVADDAVGAHRAPAEQTRA
jgi:hypothetical protein